MPVARIGFTLMPDGFFDRNPVARRAAAAGARMPPRSPDLWRVEMSEHSHTGPLHLTTDAPATAAADEGQEHAGYLRTNALSLVGNVVIALGSVAPTASIALTLSAIVATTSYASPIAVLICAVPDARDRHGLPAASTCGT